MPMDATPLLQLLCALATYCTEVATVLLFAGAETNTPANADVAATTTRVVRGYSFIFVNSPAFAVLSCREFSQRSTCTQANSREEEEFYVIVLYLSSQEISFAFFGHQFCTLSCYHTLCFIENSGEYLTCACISAKYLKHLDRKLTGRESRIT